MTAVVSKLGIDSTKIKHNRPNYIVHTLLSGFGYFVTILHVCLSFELVLKIILSSYMHTYVSMKQWQSYPSEQSAL